ncbi:MAG TPA: hypothetical protein VNG33_18420, partial [Polyangiaceae bacterium]|nr:hypothetical protein [Polyangiaceae bacterium]
LKCATFDVGTPAADGSECTQHSNQDLCHDDSWCAAGQACAPAVALNDTCDLAMPGIDVCLDGRCDSGKCTAFTVGTKAGDTCSMATAPCDAFASLACVAGKCAAANGSNCTEYYWFDRALCTPPARRTAGATCSTSAQCQSGICRPQTGCAASLCSAP